MKLGSHRIMNCDVQLDRNNDYIKHLSEETSWMFYSVDYDYF